VLELSGTPELKTMLCQKELAAFTDRSSGDVVVACTQEARLFGDVAEEGGRTQTIRFVNIRETGGWSAEARSSTPKIAALLAMAGLPEPEMVPRVSYRSEGRLLIVGPAEAALHWAGVLAPQLAVTVVITGRAMGAELPAERNFPVYSSRMTALSGWLGAFTAAWAQENPIDLDLCTRCNACIRACPEHAIDWSYQIDLDAARRIECAAAAAQPRHRPRAAIRPDRILRSRARFARHTADQIASATAGVPRARKRPGRAGAGGCRARSDGR
jgi:ferredoxin